MLPPASPKLWLTSSLILSYPRMFFYHNWEIFQRTHATNNFRPQLWLKTRRNSFKPTDPNQYTVECRHTTTTFLWPRVQYCAYRIFLFENPISLTILLLQTNFHILMVVILTGFHSTCTKQPKVNQMKDGSNHNWLDHLFYLPETDLHTKQNKPVHIITW